MLPAEDFMADIRFFHLREVRCAHEFIHTFRYSECKHCGFIVDNETRTDDPQPKG